MSREKFALTIVFIVLAEKHHCCSICTNNCLSPYELHFSVKNKIDEIKKSGKDIDYILFAGSGDPALDSNLSQEISILREFGYKIAVLQIQHYYGMKIFKKT